MYSQGRLKSISSICSSIIYESNSLFDLAAFGQATAHPLGSIRHATSGLSSSLPDVGLDLLLRGSSQRRLCWRWADTATATEAVGPAAVVVPLECWAGTIAGVPYLVVVLACQCRSWVSLGVEFTFAAVRLTSSLRAQDIPREICHLCATLLPHHLVLNSAIGIAAFHLEVLCRDQPTSLK